MPFMSRLVSGLGLVAGLTLVPTGRAAADVVTYSGGGLLNGAPSTNPVPLFNPSLGTLSPVRAWNEISATT